eukprot:1293731-Rhodomonas_salina.3
MELCGGHRRLAAGKVLGVELWEVHLGEMHGRHVHRRELENHVLELLKYHKLWRAHTHGVVRSRWRVQANLSKTQPRTRRPVPSKAEDMTGTDNTINNRFLGYSLLPTGLDWRSHGGQCPDGECDCQWAVRSSGCEGPDWEGECEGGAVPSQHQQAAPPLSTHLLHSRTEEPEAMPNAVLNAS